MDPRILLIDDDPGLLAVLKLGLEREGYAVSTAKSGEEGLRQAYEVHPDLVIVDLMMADMDGWTTCERLRQVSDVPIIILSARSSKKDAVTGLSLGADDYLTKPCSFDELKTRIRALLRRRDRSGGNPDAVYDDGTLRVDLRDGTVTRRGEQIALTPTESRLLINLISEKGQIVPHKELLTRVWGPEYATEMNYLGVYITYLRRKIEDNPHAPRYIRTRWKMGYYFAGSVAT